MVFLNSSTASAQKTFAPEIDIIVVGKLEKQTWHSIYYKGEKIGYASRALQKIGSAFLATDITYFRMPVGGVVQEVLAQSLTTVDSTFAVRTFSFEIQSGAYRATAEGKVENGKIRAVLTTPESSDSLSIPIEGELYSPSFLPDMFIAAKRAGKEFTGIASFEPLSLSRSTYQIRWSRRTKRNVLGTEREVWKLLVEASGMSSEMWVDDDGNVVYETSPSGFEQIIDEPNDALRFDLSQSGNSDLLTGFGIRAKWGSKVEARDAYYAEYVLDKNAIQLLELADFNQVLAGDTLRICSQGFAQTQKSPLPTPADTAEEPFIQKNDKRITRAARKIVGDATDTLEMAQALFQHLYSNVKKEYQSSIPSALDVLAKMRGDCNEHATLFAALARSLNIPTRINIGLVYMPETGYFLYHAWNQCFIAGKWHSFDATIGQSPADAAHIKLLSGSLEKQVQIIRLSSLTITVLDAKEFCP